MNILSQKSVFFVVALVSLALLCPSAGSAGSITDDLKTAVDKVLGIMQNPAYGAPDKKEARQKLINTEIAGKFDWEEMSRPSMVENCFSSGVATEEAIVSGLAPGRLAET